MFSDSCSIKMTTVPAGSISQTSPILEPSPFQRAWPVHAVRARWISHFSVKRQWVGIRFYDKLAHAKNSVYQALIWIRPGYKAATKHSCRYSSHFVYDMSDLCSIAEGSGAAGFVHSQFSWKEKNGDNQRSI